MSNEEPIKKCVDCGQTGHTSTECNNGKVGILILFGVRIDPTADQSKEDGNEPINSGVPQDQHLGGLSEPKSTDEVLTTHNDENGSEPKTTEEVLTTHNNENGLSIDLEDLSDEHSHDKKKGMPWTEDEHRSFLIGLEILGRGHWRAISKQYVPSRTPTQVASHAQKYFIRMKSTEDKRKRRSSLFDMPSDEYSIALGASVRPLAAPKARTYGVEGYHRFPDTIGYDRHDHIPLVKYSIEESVHPLDQRTERFATLMSRPLLITNGEKRNTQEPEVETTKD